MADYTVDGKISDVLTVCIMVGDGLCRRLYMPRVRTLQYSGEGRDFVSMFHRYLTIRTRISCLDVPVMPCHFSSCEMVVMLHWLRYWSAQATPQRSTIYELPLTLIDIAW